MSPLLQLLYAGCTNKNVKDVPAHSKLFSHCTHILAVLSLLLSAQLKEL